MDGELPIGNGFKEQFEFKEQNYLAHIKHYTVVSEDELIQFRVKDGEFLVHLFSLEGCVSFKIYLDEDLIWKSCSSEIIAEQELIDVLGFVIDMNAFYG
jgi:hypothetical protein